MRTLPTTHSAPGWFGKLAVMGDFASRRLGSDWVSSCDQWLSAGMQSSREQLGENWLNTYLAAPVWRFAWGPGVVDSQWWFGVLMPSCDNVGRYFPLVVAQARGRAPADRFALDHLDLWWQQVAQAALRTLVQGASVEEFEQGLAELPPWPSDGGSWLRTQPAPDRSRHLLSPGATLGDLAHGLASQELQRRLTGASLWWPLRNGQDGGSCTVLPGLPPHSAFAAMLVASW